MKYIVSWSGGKDSTAMLFELIERGFPIDEVVRVDTTIEFEELNAHCDEVVEFISRHYPHIKFTLLKPDFDFEYYMFEYEKKRGSKAGSVGLGWPNPNYLWCRKFLKLGVIDSYLNNVYGNGNYMTYLGIAYDEYDRYPDSFGDNCIYPLISWKYTELTCLHKCWSLGFYSNGIYDRFFRVSCWCCFQQSIKDLYMLYTFYPEKWKKLKSLNESQSNRFRKDYSLEELESKFSRLSFDVDNYDLNSVCCVSSNLTKVYPTN